MCHQCELGGYVHSMEVDDVVDVVDVVHSGGGGDDDDDGDSNASKVMFMITLV